MAITGISTPNRVVGLSSGLDTETMVKNMLSAQQLKVDRSYRQNVKAKWKLEAYTELNTAVSSFRNSYLSSLGANSMVKSSVYNTYAVNMASNSAVSITANGTAQAGHFSISKVKMATADSASAAANSQRTGVFSAQGSLLQASVTGGQTGLSAETSIKDAFGLESDDEGISFSVNINGTVETFSAGGAGATLGITGDSESEETSLEAKLAAKGITMSFDAEGRITLTGKTGDTLSFSNISSQKAFTEEGVFGIDEGATVDAVSGVTGTKAGLAATDTVAKAFGISSGDTLSFNLSSMDESLTFSGTDTLADIQTKLAENGVTMSFTDDGRVNLKTVGMETVSFTNGAGATAFNEVGVLGINIGEVARESAISGGTLLSELGIEEETAFAINGTSITVDRNTTVQGLMDAVNHSGAGVTMRYDATQGVFALTTNGSGNTSLQALSVTDGSGKIFGENGLTKIKAGQYNQPASIVRTDTIAMAALKMGVDLSDPASGVVDGKMSITVNDKTFEFGVNKDTLTSMMYEINDSTAGAVFSFSEMGDNFSISSSDTGLNAELSFSGLEIFGLSSGSVVQGENAEVTLSDGRILRQSSNYFTMDGLTFSLTGNFEAATASEALNVEVNRDYSPTIESVKGLVKAYNELVTKLNTYYTEELDYDYDPLTEEEEDAVTEKQAEELTEKAKSGILRNDAGIGSLLTSLRSAITVKVGDTGMSLQDLGITTVAWDSSKWKTEQGTLQLDEAKLKEALESDPTAVQNVLAATGDTSVSGSGASATSEAGFLTRINGFMQQYNTTMRTATLTTAAQDVTDTAEKTDDLKLKLLEQEESYWKKFSTLETMMSQLNSQQSYLTSMLGSLNKSSS